MTILICVALQIDVILDKLMAALHLDAVAYARMPEAKALEGHSGE